METKKIKILTIGDLHGRTNWFKFADISMVYDKPNLPLDYDMYIWTGDYCDSFTESNMNILDNLKKLVEFKTNYPDNVILLLGNHDLQYMYPLSIRQEFYSCSGFRPEAYWDLNIFFNENKDKFQMAYQYENYIWSHAGIHIGWYMTEFPYTSTKIANDLNVAFNHNLKCLFDCGMRRGGNKKQGGPFWADKIETWTKPIKGYHQIVGHTATKDIVTHFPYKRKDTSITYVDCVEYDKYYILEI